MPQTAEYAFLDDLKTLSGIKSSAYEFSADRQMLESLNTLYPVKMIAKAIIEFQLKFIHGDHLGSSVKVTERQFPDLHKMNHKAAEVLDMQAPDLFVKQNPFTNAYTIGVDADNVFVVVTSGLVDLMDPKELLFVIGHELGHIKSNHTLFHTMANAIMQNMMGGFGVFLNLIGPLMLMAWQRRSEITCDRAGLLCCQDETAAMRAMVKVGLGSRKLFDQINLEEFLGQVRELESSMAGINEMFVSHPYLPKRVRALQLFAQSELYVSKIRADATNYISTEELDRLVSELLFSSKYGDAAVQHKITNEDALCMLGALAVAWSDGKLDEHERDAIADLINEYQLDDDTSKALQAHYDKRVTVEEVERALAHFPGEKENVFYAAAEFAYEPEVKLSRRRRNVLYRLGEICGLESTRVMNDLAKRDKNVRTR